MVKLVNFKLAVTHCEQQANANADSHIVTLMISRIYLAALNINVFRVEEIPKKIHL